MTVVPSERFSTFTLRQDCLCEILQNFQADAILVSHVPHIRYLTGFSGSTALLLFLKDRHYIFFTDFRYQEQAKIELSSCPNTEIVMIQNEYWSTLCEFMNRQKISALVFDSKKVTCHQFSILNKGCPSIQLVPAMDICAKAMQRKSPWEIDLIFKAANISDEIFGQIGSDLSEGGCEYKLAAKMEYQGRLKGSEGPSFPTIVASGKNAALPHAQASEKPFENGDCVILDYGQKYQGYCSDLTRTVFLRTASSKLKEIYSIVLQAQKKALAVLKPGVSCVDVDREAREFIEKSGYGKNFGHGLGHGVGIEVHEEPKVSPFSKDILEEGMVVTIEPGIYIPDLGGVRIEDMVVITKDGYRNLVHADKQMMEI